MRSYHQPSTAERDDTIDGAFVSVFFEVFACASSLLPRAPGSLSLPGIGYYQRGLFLNSALTGEGFIEQVQYLSFLALCSAGWKPPSQNWILSGEAARIAQDLGLHRPRNAPTNRCRRIGRLLTDRAHPLLRALEDEARSRCRGSWDHVPMCEKKEQAEAVVPGCRYSPAETRGVGAMCANSAFDIPSWEYIIRANNCFVVIVEIESRTAVEHCEEIAAVAGVDMLFVGPNDWTSSMGYVALGYGSIGEVQEAIAKVLKAAEGVGRYAGHFALGP
ncbi:Pyruvate/Phosphoenolpyruvate kinase-like domain-containing protein [Aspergillus pseudoustus]|uniref:Pyruvate/Phosphoenolpyruvate kinase-like domain-containing protein n=1 Tax=Aspergillus pseudoustus TaxID=1810923 RepID=A0ABR4KND5_9EURO